MERIAMRVRLLPVVIVAASVMLAVKVGGFWSGVQDVLQGSIAIDRAHADEAPKQTTAASPEPEPAHHKAAADARAHADETSANAEEPPSKDAPAEADAPSSSEEPAKAVAPAPLSPAEIDVLQQLAKRRDTLDARGRELDERAVLMQAAEKRIDQKSRELKELQATLEQLIATHDEQEEARIRSLVKIYENMKPKDAARIFEELEMDTLLQVAERMKERKLAPIMAQMNPAKAKEMTVELAQLRQIPQMAGGPATK